MKVSRFEPGDVVVLVTQVGSRNPPIDTIGTITKLYSAVGGPAAYVQWNCDNPKKYSVLALLEQLEMYDGSELNESDVNLDVLFGGAVV